MANDHHDEKGHFSHAQSSVAKKMRTTMGGKAERAFPHYGTEHTFKSKSGRHMAYSVSSMLAGERDRGAQKRSAGRAKLKVIARGKKHEGHKAYTKIGLRMHRKGLLKPPA